MSKKILFIFTTFFFFLFIPFTHARTFSDVPEEAWYYDYVQQLADEGVLDEGLYFRPDDRLNRAELLKMVLVATSGLEDYTAPETPSFKDVPAGAWYYSYVEAAAAAGIIEGYQDAQGKPTGFFGPADTVNRAAAAKIVVNAFNIPTNASPPSVFPDVNEGDWFYPFVLTAYNASILNGYEDGRFGPADPITRAQAAKIIANAMNYEAEEIIQEETEEETEEEAEIPLPEGQEPEEETGIPAEPNSSAVQDGPVAGGVNGVYLARYDLTSLYESCTIETLTVVNDVTGNNFGDDPEGTPAIKAVTLKYADVNGLLKTSTVPFGANGITRFTDLEFYVPRDKEAFLEVYADFNSMGTVGESLSGKVVRLGIQNVNNTDASFRAIGNASQELLPLGGRVNFTNSRIPEAFTVRKSLPVFNVVNEGSVLVSGENDLIVFTVTANEAGPVSLGRIVFDVTVSGSFSLGSFRLIRDGESLNDEINIYNATGGSDVKSPAAGTVASGTSRVILSFNQEETFFAGETATYRLRATALNTGDGDTVVTRFGDSDEDTPLSGLSAHTNPNTGRIYSDGDATEGIFTGAADFSRSAGVNRDIIWSDKSAASHVYPAITNGTVTDGSGSYDWTNGYSLGIYSLPDSILTR